MRCFGNGVRCLPIPIARGVYWAGEDGSIWRPGHVDAHGVWQPEHRLRARLYGSTADTQRRGRYLCASLFVNGVNHEFAIHRLVAEAWLPDFHWLLEVHHINGDPTDNRPGNLACLTRAEHERAHGLDVTDYDIVNARYDFELHRNDPRPDPFASPRRGRKKYQQWSMARHVEQMMRQIGNLERAMERASGAAKIASKGKQSPAGGALDADAHNSPDNG